MKDGKSPALLKIFIAAFAAMVLMLAAFGVGLTVGAGQTRHVLRTEPSTASAAVCEQQAAQPVEVAAVPQLATPAEQAAIAEEPATAAKPTSAAAEPTSTPAPSPAPTKQPPTPVEPADNSAAPDSPLDVEYFNEAWKLLREEYYGKLPEGKDVTYAAIRGVIQALGDQHTAFMDPKQAEMYRQGLEGDFEGIGAGVEQDQVTGGVKIKYLYPDQPADKAGIKENDVIVAVDGKDITGTNLSDAIGLIRGPKGTQVTLSVLREGEEEPLEFKVTRARIEIKIVDAKTLSDGKIEYIALAEFNSPSTNRMAEALKAAVDKKPKGIVLDLRGNPGGYLDAAVRIGSFFVPEGNIVLERFADGKVKTHERVGRYLLNNIPLAVLVDGGSASASEIVAGAIQDAGVGKLIGETTYGKGSVQLQNTMSDDSELKITTARWFTPKDRTIDGTGLEPDMVVPMTDDDRDAERDPQLDRAVEYLLTGK